MKREPLLIVFASQKGGVGRTAFTVSTAGISRYQRGYNVAMVDYDPPQYNISLMWDCDLECVRENDSLKIALYRQYKQRPQKAYPTVKSESKNAVENFYRYMREQKTKFGIMLSDLPRAFRCMGMIRTLALMHYILIPLKADDAVMQSAPQFASIIREELASHRGYPLKGIHLFWNMIDKREDKGTFETQNRTICDSKLHLMVACVPETKRYNREANSMRGDTFRSTLLLPSNRQVKGSGLMELVDKICGIIGLAEKQGESPMTNLMQISMEYTLILLFLYASYLNIEEYAYTDSVFKWRGEQRSVSGFPMRGEPAKSREETSEEVVIGRSWYRLWQFPPMDGEYMVSEKRTDTVMRGRKTPVFEFPAPFGRPEDDEVPERYEIIGYVERPDPHRARGVTFDDMDLFFRFMAVDHPSEPEWSYARQVLERLEGTDMERILQAGTLDSDETLKRYMKLYVDSDRESSLLTGKDRGSIVRGLDIMDSIPRQPIILQCIWRSTMIQADLLRGHFPKRTKAARRQSRIQKKEVAMTGYYDSE